MVQLGFHSVRAETITVVVIDSGIDASNPHLCKFGHKSFVKRLPDPLSDEYGHGTHVAGLISSTAGEGNYCLVSIKYYDERASGKENLKSSLEALQYAIDIKAKFINFSGGGPEFVEDEYLLIKKALSKHIKLVMAAGNEHDNLDKVCNYYPACYDTRIVMVGNLEITENYGKSPSPSSNYGNRVTRWEVGTNLESTLPGGKTGYKSGTSQACAVASGKLLREILRK